jgi:hypothetical protein
MIELLIGTIMAFLIIAPLLGFVVSVLNDDTREQAKSENDFEQQAAISFISEDLGQAYYIYTPEEIKDDIKNDLSAINGDGTPVLAFWKQQTIPNAVPPIGDSDTIPQDCGTGEGDNIVKCDDTTVRALVVYYLFNGNDDDNKTKKIWCSPEGDNCPKRIVRYVVKDGLEIARGTGVLYDENLVKDSQKRTPGFNPAFNPKTPTENVTEGNVDADGQVLINYISDFTVSDVPDTHDSAKITIQSDGLRRIDGNKSCEDQQGVSAFCPTATVQIQGLTLDF